MPLRPDRQVDLAAQFNPTSIKLGVTARAGQPTVNRIALSPV